MRASARANALLRAGILRAADDGHVKRFMGRYGMRLGAARFVAGETLDECVVALRRLADQGLHANTTLLGESIRDRAETEAVADEYGRIFERLHAERLPVNVALKLTHLGLELDEELAYTNVERVVRVAERVPSFVRIDMEQSSVVDATLRIYRRLREAGHERVGTVLQSYLFRTESDLESLLPLAPNLRFVKGAYLEPPEVAYSAKADVDAAYARLVEASLRGGGYTAIATHDEALIGRCLGFAEREGIGRDRFELQMLYGVRPGLQLELVRRGYKVLVATPFGPEWYRTSCGGSPSGPRTSASSRGTSCGADPGRCPTEVGHVLGEPLMRARRTPRRGRGRGRSARGARRAGREPGRRLP